MSGEPPQAPPIRDYGLIGDCHGVALVSRKASIDWCCLPRFDSASCFGRLLDWERGGHCSVALEDAGARSESFRYLPDTLVLETVLTSGRGALRVLDFFAMREGGRHEPRLELVRIVECLRGVVDAHIEIAPRFDYGEVTPWLQRIGIDGFAATGGDSCLLIWSSRAIEAADDMLRVRAELRAGERLRLLVRFVAPHLFDDASKEAPRAAQIDARLDETTAWWRRWTRRVRVADDGPDWAGVTRSALTLKALTYAPSGAIVAAPTTSLPEVAGGVRNWDYRYSWIRDSALAAHALNELGCGSEAARFRHFVVRSSAGHAADLQILFGIAGERRIYERDLPLAGYRGAQPVRVGNNAVGQLQLDSYGEVLNLAWRWHLRGRSPDDDEWRFFAEIVERAVERWSEPDRGIWEWRGRPRHFVHSKALCWAAIDRGLRLAQECRRSAPVRRWRKARAEIATAIDEHGYDRKRGVFVQAFDSRELDAATLLLPVAGYVEFTDARLARTADAIRDELGAEGYIRRYVCDDELPGTEGAFLACSFWLAECYARQGRAEEARQVFDRAVAAASPLGLFSEEVDPASGELLGNFPQTLTHLSHVAAAVAIAESPTEPAAPVGR